MIYLRDLPSAASPSPPGPSLYCPSCQEQYSACAGDYFWMPATKPFRCQACRRPLVLAVPDSRMRVVKR